MPIVSCHNHVKPSNVNCWPTIHNGRKVKQPSMFKITQHINNWEVGRLFFQCTTFLVVDVPPFGYGQIDNIFSDDN